MKQIAFILSWFVGLIGIAPAFASDLIETAAPIRIVLPQQMTLPAGTKVLVELREKIKSGDAKAGMTINLATAANILDGAGNIMIPKGTPVSGTVVESKGAGGFGKPGRLVIRCTSIDLPSGTKIPLQPRTDKLPQNGENKAAYATASGLLAGVVAAIGLVFATFGASFTGNLSNAAATTIVFGGGALIFALTSSSVRGGNVTLDAGRGFEVQTAAAATL